MRRLTDMGLLFLRVGVGATLLGVHGWARLMRAFGYLFLGQQWTFIALVHNIGFPMPAVFAVASALAESVGRLIADCRLWVRDGRRWRWASIWRSPWLELSKHSAAIELPAVYLIAVTAIGIAGAGSYSLDARFSRPASVEPDYAAKR